MARPTINASDCKYTYYKYYFNSISTGKKSSNYLPIIVIELPYSDSELDVNYGWHLELRPEEMNTFGTSISDMLGNHLPCILSMSRHSGIVSSAYPWTSYEDGNFTSRLTLYSATNSDHETDWLALMDLGLRKPSAGTVLNIGGNAVTLTESKKYTDEAQGVGLFLCLLRTTSGTLYYNRENASRNASTFNTGHVITSPSADKFGGITFNPPFTLSTITPTTIWESDYDIPLKKLIGESTKTDIKDPNPGGGDSKPGGGGGGGDIGGDTNPDDGLPTISALDSGLLTAYNPTVTELQSLGRFLWSDSFDISAFKKLFNDPFDTLLGLSVVPVKPNTSGTKSIMFGNMDSGVSAPVVANQWVKKDMGSVTLNEVWRGALDYAPSTGVSIYLPFIGMRQLNVNDVMGSTIHLIYKFDVLTGSCTAQLYVNHDSQGNKNGGFSWNENQGLLYEFIGQCAENIPLASQDFTNTIRAAIGGVAVAAGAAASIATGNPAIGIAALTVGAANAGMQASTPTVERGGHLSGSASIMGYSQPFLIVERPHQCKPSRYYALRGVPSQVYTSKLSNCTGFTQITANNNLHIAGASDSELAELQNLLVSGVYFPDSKR